MSINASLACLQHKWVNLEHRGASWIVGRRTEWGGGCFRRGGHRASQETEHRRGDLLDSLKKNKDVHGTQRGAQTDLKFAGEIR